MSYFSNKKKNVNSFQNFYSKITDNDIEFIRSFPNYYQVDKDKYIIHAGARANIPIEKQNSTDLLYLRYVSDQGKFIPIRKILTDRCKSAQCNFLD